MAFSTEAGTSAPSSAQCELTPLAISRIASSMPWRRPRSKYDRAQDHATAINPATKTTSTKRKSTAHAPTAGPEDPGTSVGEFKPIWLME
jgi:hypothetical protein